MLKSANTRTRRWLTHSVIRLFLFAALWNNAGVVTAAPRGGLPSVVSGTPVIISGARLVPAIDRAGTPLPLSGSAPFTNFVHPVAAAQHGNDLYVADLATNRVLRLDMTSGVMAVLPWATASIGVRIAVGGDGSLYALDKPGRRVLRFGRDGTLLASYADARNLVQPIAFVVDDPRGEVLVADGMYLHLVAFHPLGGAAQVAVLRGNERNTVLSIAGMARGPDGWHLSDPACGCVAVIGRDGAVRSTYGHREIGRPETIAIDRHGRVFVADTFQRAVKVFEDGRLIDSIPAAAIGVIELNDLSITDSALLVADGAGARVASLRIGIASRTVRK